MKKIIALALLAASVTFAHAQTVTAIVTNYGIAPVPAFKLGKPATILIFDGNLIKTKTFSLDASPDLALNLKNGQGWFGDTWLSANKTLDSAGRWTASAAMSWSIVFGQQPDGSTKSVPYPTERLRLRYVMNIKNTFDVEYWYNAAVPAKDGIKGDYTSFQYTRTQPLKAFSASIQLNLFHLNYSDGTNGFAEAITGSIAHKSGLFISSQFINNINATNVKGCSNISIGYTRKI